MAENTKADAPPSCPTVDALPEKDQKMLLNAFNLAVSLAERVGIPEAELFQLLEDVIDGRAVDEARAEMERTGEKPVPWEKVKEDLGL